MTERDAFETRFHAALRGYVGRVTSDLNALDLARRIAAEEPRNRVTHGGLGSIAAAFRGPIAPAPGRVGLLLVLLLATLLAALTVGPLIASRWLEDSPPQHRSELVPTGIDALSAETGWYSRAVMDGKGIVWARESGGRLMRFDPSEASARSWTVADDAAFAMTDIAPARNGGVWLIDGRMLRWFDATVFRDVIEAPAEIVVLTDATDGTLWAGTADGEVLHRTGSSWQRLDPGRPKPGAAISAVAVDAGGRAWIGWMQEDPNLGYAKTGWVSRYDGSGWTTFDENDAAPLAGGIVSIAQSPDGSLWVATTRGIARFDGSSWTDETLDWSSEDYTPSSISVATDGSVWIAGASEDYGATKVGRSSGRSWTSWDRTDGLPAEAMSWHPAIMPADQGVFVGTGDGIYQLSNDRFARAWPTAPRAAAGTRILLAVSRDELWARGDAGLWHLHDRSWTYEEIPSSLMWAAPDVLTRAPDGTLWAGGRAGVAYRHDGHWTKADTRPVGGIAFDDVGTMWVAGLADPELWTLRFDGTSWVRRSVEGCPLGPAPGRALAFDARGTLWVAAGIGWVNGGLARYDGQRWEKIEQVGGSKIDGARILGTTSRGEGWIGIAVEGDQRAVHFDGLGWTVVSMPEGSWTPAVVAPDGTLWASTERGPASYDGQRWAFPYAAIGSTTTRVDAIAGDGSVFGSSEEAILLRFPAPTSP